MATDVAGRRFGVIGLIAVLLFATLGARLYFLQVMRVQEAQEVVAGNRVREVYFEAPRGEIFDANGNLLAGRRESLVVTLDWTELREVDGDEREAVFRRLASELSASGLKTKADQLERAYSRAVDGTLKPVVVADDVSEDVWIRLSEQALHGIDVERRSVRTYPYGTVGAHLVGYTGQVRDTEQAELLNEESDKIYFPGDELGIAGLEKLYEEELRGTPELRRVEVDSRNRVVRTIEIVQPPVPGNDIFLTLDINLQYAAEQILADELAQARERDHSDDSLPHVADSGSLVAINVGDGSIAAMASYPSFDPADFTFGISSSLWSELTSRADLPLLDRTIRGTYPAGSTFKPITAYASQDSGARDQFFTWADEGVFTLESCLDDAGAGCKFRNAGSAVLGNVQLREALERSSDTYFYSLGETFWTSQSLYGRTVMQDTAARFGLGERTGIGLPAEAAGRVPTPENRKEEFGEEFGWFPGDNVNLSIGQGDLLVTPLQLANAYATLATGGVRYQPNLVQAVVTGTGDDAQINRVEPVQVADEQLDPAYLMPIVEGLLAVVDPNLGSPSDGTGVGAFRGFPLANYPIAGKTGTAEVARKADFSLFAGFGPVPNPEYAVAAILEQAGFGGDAAAPAVRRMFEYLGGFTPIPEAPLAGERELAIFGISDVSILSPDSISSLDLSPSAIAAAAEAANAGSTSTTQPPTTRPPATAAPTTRAPTTAAPTTASPTSASTTSTPATTAPSTTVATSTEPTSSTSADPADESTTTTAPTSTTASPQPTTTAAGGSTTSGGEGGGDP